MRVFAIIILVAGVAIGFFVYNSEINRGISKFPFKFGLDIAGGTQLIYRADMSGLKETLEIKNSMQALRDVIEKRINVFGVSEPLIQIEKGGIGNSSEQRLIVELPGVTDIKKAIEMIGKTPLLEFKLLDKSKIPEKSGDGNAEDNTIPQEAFLSTGLTGRMLKSSQLQFGSGSKGAGFVNEPVVLLKFNNEGTELFAKITKENIGEVLAIFLDGQPISLPVIQQEIKGGDAQITGSFTPEEAKQLVRDLNLGALPVPIELISTQTVGASLGEDIKDNGIMAGIIGIILVMIFMVLWYRLPGVIAAVSLCIYIIMMLSLFKLIPVVLTAAGIAGFILSIGMAVDANVLIFERMKEEIKVGNNDITKAVENGFSRAWFSIRDSNISGIITAVILFWFGTSLVKGFALTYGIGIMMSMLTAILISRTFLLSIVKKDPGKFFKYLIG